MKLTIAKSELTKTLSHVARVVERRNTIPILSNVLLVAAGNTLRLKATDLDLEVSEEVVAKIEQPGATTVPATLLNDIARKLADGDVTMKMDDAGQIMAVGAGRSSFKLQCIPQADFPELNAGSFSHSFEIEAKKLRWLIDKTQFAISTEETRYYLNGIYFHSVEVGGKPKLRSVATDGHRLARAEMDAPDGSEGMPGIIIPRKTVGELHKLLDGADTIAVEMSDTKIRFTIGGVILTSKLIDGTFPDYERVIPTRSNMVALADRKQLTAAADRVSTVSSERGRAIKLSISAGTMNLAVSNPENGSAEEDMAIDYGADPVEIGFNVKYLQDVLSQVDGDNARVYLIDGGSPTIITSEADDSALFVLMPMRV